MSAVPSILDTANPSEVAARAELGAEARARLDGAQTVRQALDVLADGEHLPDAVRLLAHAMPKRQAVWWACLCAREVAGAALSAEESAALQAAEAWVQDPSEDHRRAAMPAAEAAGFGRPAGCAAVAAFWSGGSLGPPDVPAIPPGEQLTAHAVTGSVMLAVVQNEPEKATEKYQAFLKRGIEVASGAHRWPEPVRDEAPVETPPPSPPPPKPTEFPPEPPAPATQRRPTKWQWD